MYSQTPVSKRLFPHTVCLHRTPICETIPMLIALLIDTDSHCYFLASDTHIQTHMYRDTAGNELLYCQQYKMKRKICFVISCKLIKQQENCVIFEQRKVFFVFTDRLLLRDNLCKCSMLWCVIISTQ